MEFVIRPLLWWLILPAVLLGAYAWAQRRRAPDAVRYSSLALMRAALAGRPSTAFRRHVPPVLVAISVALGILALARPYLRTPIPKERATIMLVLDVSGSMGTRDMFPSRLGAAKRASEAFVDALPADFRIGVVAFSSDASLVQPVTSDHGAVRAAIDGLNLGGGTAIGDGIEVALAALPPELLSATSHSTGPTRPTPQDALPASAAQGDPPPAPPAVILLLTDGQNNEGVSPLEATAKARDANVPVFTVGMGGRGGPFGLGGPQESVDEPLLREMAAQTGGQYYFAPTGGDLRRIYADLGMALGWDFVRQEISQYAAAGALVVSVAGLSLAFLWLHRQP